MSAALAVCALYFAVFIAIGFAADRRGSKTAESFYLGDRSFGAVPTALSVGASDSSGWVFTGAGNAGLEIVGSEKSLWNEPGKGLVIGKYNNTEPVKPEKARPDRVERLLAAIEGKVSKKELLEDLRCSVDAVKIMEAAYASAASGTWKPVS